MFGIEPTPLTQGSRDDARQRAMDASWSDVLLKPKVMGRLALEAFGSPSGNFLERADDFMGHVKSGTDH